MPKKINKKSIEKDHNGNNGHRKEKSRSPRGPVRSEVQVSGRETGNSGRKRVQRQKDDTRSTSNGDQPQQQTHRQTDKLGSGNNRVSSRVSDVLNHTLRPKVSERQAQLMLERLTKDHLINNPNAIIRTGDEIRAFGKYTITKNQTSYQVYRSATLAAEPSSGKVAISWCVADKYGKDALAQQLVSLDLEIERRLNDIEHYKHILAVSQDTAKKYVISDRLFESHARLKYAKEHLEECVNLAKYWQLKGFRDETARTGIKN